MISGKLLCLLVALLHLQCSLANVLPLLQEISTVPTNGDVNPYGIAFIPQAFGCKGSCPNLKSGDILVSNFNNATNVQGTGTTVVKIDPIAGTISTFYTSPLRGLSAALGVLSSGFILVGNVPNANGMGQIGTGVIQVLDCNGTLITTMTSGISAPWAMTIHEGRDVTQIFVSNVIAGNVVRIDLINNDFANAAVHQIGSTFLTRPDAAGFVVGPAGLAFDPVDDELFVASEGDNLIFKIALASTRLSDAGRGLLLLNDTLHLHGPLGLAFTSEGHLITANADGVNVDPNQPSELVEFTRQGRFLSQFSIDPNTGGAFNLAFGVIRDQTRRVLAVVDDNVPNLKIYSQGPANFFGQFDTA